MSRSKKKKKPVRRRKLRPTSVEPLSGIAGGAGQQGPPLFLVEAMNHINAGRLSLAVTSLNKGMSTDPFTAYSNLGNVYLMQKSYSEALEVLRKAHELNPRSGAVTVNLAEALIGLGRLEEAEHRLTEILKQCQHGPAYYALGQIYRRTGRPTRAVQCMKTAFQAFPEAVEFRHDLGNDLVQCGLIREGIDMLRTAVDKAPDRPEIRSDLLQQLHYLPEIDLEVLYEAYQQWGRSHAPGSTTSTSHVNAPDPDRRLRIGYISPDFYRHSVAYFFEPLLDHHNRDHIEIYGYGNVACPDEVTDRLRGKFDQYRDIHQQSDAEVIRMIEQDRIDILVDLAGHTRGNRLTVLAHKPAPIQVTYLGHPDTTGMRQVDYRLTDDLAESSASRRYYTEELIDLEDGFLCFRPPERAPEPGPSPVLKNGFITFGSFNHHGKINPTVIGLWADILKAVPDSRLRLKFRIDPDDPVIKEYQDKWVDLGIARARIEIHGLKSAQEHLAMYHDMDIALDTFPYNGTATTCEALWMGVPVVTLAGEAHCSRVGLSLLSRIGLAFFAASTPEDYVAKACALAAQPESLNKIRMSMRTRMSRSPLCRGHDFAQHVEAAYRRMWQQWCATRRAAPADISLSSDQGETLVLDGYTFRQVARTQSQDVSVGYADGHIIKIEHANHPRKLRSLSEEIELIQYLNDKGCVSCPKLVSEGRLPSGQRYVIQERIESRRRFNVPDLVFSLLEQKSFGVCQGDFKRDNLKFAADGVCYLIDYDQAVYDDSFVTMGNVEFLKAFNRFFVDRWQTFGFDFKDMYSFGGFTQEQVMSLFRDDAFNLAATTILQEQATTLTESGIYHSLHTDKLYIDGTRDLDARRAALETIEFTQGERVLDVGCNMGLLCHYLHDRGCEVTGVDMDPHIILAAKMTANILNKRIEFDPMDMDSDTIDTDYDTICLFSVIHHVKNFRQATANVAQRCHRIILECALREVGAKPIQGQWIRTSGWEFASREELIKFLEEVFTGFKFQQHHGTVDRQREILSLVKVPSPASV